MWKESRLFVSSYPENVYSADKTYAMGYETTQMQFLRVH